MNIVDCGINYSRFFYFNNKKIDMFKSNIILRNFIGFSNNTYIL